MKNRQFNILYKNVVFCLILALQLSLCGCENLLDSNRSVLSESRKNEDSTMPSSNPAPLSISPSPTDEAMPQEESTTIATEQNGNDDSSIAVVTTPEPTQSPTTPPSPTNTPTPTITPSNTPIPTFTPTPTHEPIPDYTTNTLEAAKEGKAGMFSYVCEDGDIREYVLIDFDEKEFYLFEHYLKDPEESYGACMLITGGDLNSELNVKCYTNKTLSISCKFKSKKDPSILICSDSDGGQTTYRTTDLLAMLDTVESFDIYDLSNPSNITRSNTPTPTAKPQNYTGKLDMYENDYYVYYVVNINTYKFHNTYCRHISRMYEENANYATDHGFADWEDARNWLISHGYSPCGTCCP